MKRHTILILVTILIAALVSCSYENTATVTIDTGLRKRVQINWVDKVLAFLSLSQLLQADPAPNDYLNKIILTVSAKDMNTIVQEIPISTGKITIEVPAGNQRAFIVVAGNEMQNYHFDKYYGSMVTVNLFPNQNININLEMGDLFDPTRYDGGITYLPWDNQIWITAYTDKNPEVKAFNLYRKAIESNSSEEYLLTITNFTFSQNNYSITYGITMTLDDGYEYFISAVNKYGEGNKIYVYFEMP